MLGSVLGSDGGPDFSRVRGTLEVDSHATEVASTRFTNHQTRFDSFRYHQLDPVWNHSRMIRVERLTRRYGATRAVDRISFEVGRGEIVGLLGPNGAGKTTTMRMLTTYLSPTSGRAILAGHDVLDEPLEVRRKVGYLPENVPLYSEMRVREYLLFRAKIKDVPRSRRRVAIEESMTRCRVEEVEDRIIGQLSKGYRQRVGLADTLVHDPDILILDEPTSGLDPIQIREVRSLIRELGDRHTVLISTHIMSEVEAVCSRVIIIAQGRIAEDQPLDQLQTGSTIVIEARGPADTIRQTIHATQGVEHVGTATIDGDYASFQVVPRDGHDLREVLGQRLVQNGWPLRRLEWRHVTLEDRFIQAVSRETVATAEHREAV
jgi:ABC-2 type transport system ATP-binding protein